MKHKFLWKNSVFCELYFNGIDELINELKVSCLDNVALECEKTDFIHQNLPNILIMAVRKAEKGIGVFTSNGLLRGHFVRSIYSSEIMNIVSELRYLHIF